MKRRIMLVDDDRTNLLVGKTALANYSVVTVPSARIMLENLEWCQPELILLDVVMPEMDGFEAICILKENPETRDIPVIFLTGSIDDADEQEGLRLGAVDYIRKPFTEALLNERVEMHLRGLSRNATDEESPPRSHRPRRGLGPRTLWSGIDGDLHWSLAG
jgi:CheY-like chemotaxis protein